MSYIIERFNKSEHNRTQFSCEEQALTNYLQNQLGQDEKRGLTRAFVLIHQEDPDKHVKGFYTLSSLSVSLNSEDVSQYQEQATNKGYSKIPPSQNIPSVLIGRLARHSELKGTDAGSMLMADALLSIIEIAESMAMHFVVVDTKNELAKRFYRKFGFIEFGQIRNRMYLPVATIKKSLAPCSTL